MLDSKKIGRVRTRATRAVAAPVWLISLYHQFSIYGNPYTQLPIIPVSGGKASKKTDGGRYCIATTSLYGPTFKILIRPRGHPI